MINVMIADDHEIVRTGLKWLINQSPDMSVVCEATTSSDVIPQLKKHRVDLLVLDISMPDGSFLDLMSRLKSTVPGLNILVLSAHSEEEFALRAYKAGAKGYLTKKHSSEELVSAIKIINKGGKYVPESMADILLKELDPDKRLLPHETLTNREYEIMRMLVSGKKIKAIANQLSLSPKTVSTHRTNILAKLSLNSTAELVRYALDHGIKE